MVFCAKGQNDLPNLFTFNTTRSDMGRVFKKLGKSVDESCEVIDMVNVMVS